MSREKAQILLVEDDDVLRDALAATLLRADYDVIAVENGLKAIEWVKTEAIDLVVTDLIMPDQEGIETIAQLRRLRPELPVIAMSGGGSGDSSEYLRIARGIGAKATLAKPFHPDALLVAVARHCPPRND